MMQPGADRLAKRRARLPEAVVTAARAAGVSPLTFVLRIVRDPAADRAERDAMTSLAVQYLRGGSR